MNLRSNDTNAEFQELTFKKKKKLKQTKESTRMAEKQELQHLFGELKDSLTNELQGLRLELKEFRQDCDRNIKIIMQQTVDLRKDMDQIGGRVAELEERVSSLDDAGFNNKTTMESMKSQITQMTEQMEYLENKSRQNNICIYNVPEGSEGSDLNLFLKQLIRDTFGVTQDVSILRVHRTVTEKKNSARPIIAAFLNYDFKKTVLQAAWSKKEIKLQEQRIFLDHDFTYQTRQQRSLYKPIREQLKALDIKTHIVAPAKLKVFNSDGTTTTFPNPTVAAKELEKRGLYKEALEKSRR